MISFFVMWQFVLTPGWCGRTKSRRRRSRAVVGRVPLTLFTYGRERVARLMVVECARQLIPRRACNPGPIRTPHHVGPGFLFSLDILTRLMLWALFKLPKRTASAHLSHLL
jgi:hypothetical protein